MDELKVTGKQIFSDKEIPVVVGGFGTDKKCMSDKTIAEIHSMEMFKVRERISYNIKRFMENVDFIDLKQRIREKDTLELLFASGYSKQSITQAEHIYLLSERGYAKLIKIMDSDLAWEIHDKLIDEYFQLREEKFNYNNISPELKAILMHDEKIVKIESRVDILENTANISNHQQNLLKKSVNKTVIKCLGGKNSAAYKRISKVIYSECNHDIQDYFNVASRNDIPRVRFDEALQYIEAWQPSTNNRLLIEGCNRTI